MKNEDTDNTNDRHKLDVGFSKFEKGVQDYLMDMQRTGAVMREIVFLSDQREIQAMAIFVMGGKHCADVNAAIASAKKDWGGSEFIGNMKEIKREV